MRIPSEALNLIVQLVSARNWIMRVAFVHRIHAEEFWIGGISKTGPKIEEDRRVTESVMLPSDECAVFDRGNGKPGLSVAVITENDRGIDGIHLSEL